MSAQSSDAVTYSTWNGASPEDYREVVPTSGVLMLDRASLWYSTPLPSPVILYFFALGHRLRKLSKTQVWRSKIRFFLLDRGSYLCISHIDVGNPEKSRTSSPVKPIRKVCSSLYMTERNSLSVVGVCRDMVVSCCATCGTRDTGVSISRPVESQASPATFGCEMGHIWACGIGTTDSVVRWSPEDGVWSVRCDRSCLASHSAHWLYSDANVDSSMARVLSVKEDVWFSFSIASFVMDCRASTNRTPILAVMFPAAIFRRQSKPKATRASYAESRSRMPDTSVTMTAVLQPWKSVKEKRVMFLVRVKFSKSWRSFFPALEQDLDN